jgi:hypothetical protein
MSTPPGKRRQENAMLARLDDGGYRLSLPRCKIIVEQQEHSLRTMACER